jgi:hyperosmotically inducible protein
VRSASHHTCRHFLPAADSRLFTTESCSPAGFAAKSKHLHGEPGGTASRAGGFRRAAALFLLVGVIDLIWQRHRYTKQLSMTKQEIREESKEQESSPHIKTAAPFEGCYLEDAEPTFATILAPESSNEPGIRERTMSGFGFAGRCGAAIFALASALSANTGIPVLPEQASLEQRVREEVASLRFYSVFDNLSFRVDGTRVELSGQVTQPVVKEDAERAVRRLPGVVSVTTQIEVLPLSRVDDRIRRDVYYAVYGYGPLQRYGAGTHPAIRIVVKNGNVSLIGAVANTADRAIVYQRANSVPGVFSVSNHLLVEI